MQTQLKKCDEMIRMSERNVGSPCFPKEDANQSSSIGMTNNTREEIRHELEPMQLHFGSFGDENEEATDESQSYDKLAESNYKGDTLKQISDVVREYQDGPNSTGPISCDRDYSIARDPQKDPLDSNYESIDLYSKKSSSAMLPKHIDSQYSSIHPNKAPTENEKHADGHEGITIDYRNCSLVESKRSSMKPSDKQTI